MLKQNKTNSSKRFLASLMETVGREKSTPEFKYSISKSLVLGLVLLIVMIISASFVTIWYEGRPRLLEMNKDFQTKFGQNISLALERDMQEVRGVVLSMASAAMALAPEQRLDTIPEIIPPILDAEGEESIYAGGGIWPEPNVFQEGVARKSFFWAKNAQGELEFFDNYNDPHGPGYHDEEWYVPAQVFEENKIYWSRSYTDPYSLQPMVTCTARMEQNGEFKGVATVDLKLEGVSRVLNQLIAGFDAYAFIVDRNNRFIVFPTLGFDVSRAQMYSGGQSGFEFLGDLSRVYPAFSEINQRLEDLDDTLYETIASERPELASMVNRLAEGSYQINEEEARRLVNQYWLSGKVSSVYPKPIEIFEIENDLLLRGASTAFIYQMPTTNWRVITVFEKKSYGGISEAVTKKLFGAILLSSVIFGIVAFFLLKIHVIDRIGSMVNSLNEMVDDQEDENGVRKLEYKRNDELGLLAYWFNQRSEYLEKLIRHALRESKAKSDFLAGMSHELRTPINSIVGFNRRLIVKLGGDLEEQNYKTLIAIQRSSNHLLSLVDDLFEVSQLEAGKVKIRFEWENVNLLLDDAVSQMAGQIADAGLDFNVTSLSEDMRIFVDRQKVIQVLLHLLNNALRATSSGSIHIYAEATELAGTKAVSISVADTGKGIDEANKHMIFKQLSQVQEHSGLQSGIGLGLYLVREITAMHSGAVFFDSEVGKGSTFRVVFPINAKKT